MKKIIGLILSAVMCLTMLFAAGCGLIEKETTDDEEKAEIMKLLEDVDLNIDSSYQGTLKILYQNIPS